MTDLARLADLEAELGARLRAAFDTVLADDSVTVQPADRRRSEAGHRRAAASRRSRNGWLSLAAAVMLIAGTAVGLIRRQQASVTAPASVPGSNHVDPSPVSAVRVPQPPATVGEFELTSLSAEQTGPDGEDRSAHVQYVRRTGDGVLTGWIGLVARVVPAEARIESPNATVHGAPAWIEPEGGPTRRVEWREGDVMLRLRAHGLSTTELTHVAEATRLIDTTTGPGVTLPAPERLSFHAIPSAPRPPTGALHLSFILSDPAGARVVVQVLPNWYGETLESLEARSTTANPRQVLANGRTVVISDGEVGWIQGPDLVAVFGQPSREADVLAVAATIEVSDLTHLATLRQHVVHGARQRPLTDRATLSDGTSLEIRAAGSGPVLCVGRHVTACSNELTGQRSDLGGVAYSVRIDGTPWTFAWVPGHHRLRGSEGGAGLEMVTDVGTWFAAPSLVSVTVDGGGTRFTPAVDETVALLGG